MSENQTTLADEIMAEAEPCFGPRDLDDPKFDDAGKVHDWRNHVPDILERLWPRLSAETRAAVYLLASDSAGREEWD